MTTGIESRLDQEQRSRVARMPEASEQRKMNDPQSTKGVPIVTPDNRLNFQRNPNQRANAQYRDASRTSSVRRGKTNAPMPFNPGRDTMTKHHAMQPRLPLPKAEPSQPSTHRPINADHFYATGGSSRQQPQLAASRKGKGRETESVASFSQGQGSSKTTQVLEGEPEIQEVNPPTTKHSPPRKRRIHAETAQNIEQFSDDAGPSRITAQPGRVDTASEQDEKPAVRSFKTGPTRSIALPFAVSGAYLDGRKCDLKALTITPRDEIDFTPISVRAGQRKNHRIFFSDLRGVMLPSQPNYVLAFKIAHQDAKKLAEWCLGSRSIASDDSILLIVEFSQEVEPSEFNRAIDILKRSKALGNKEILPPEAFTSLLASIDSNSASSPDPLGLGVSDSFELVPKTGTIQYSKKHRALVGTKRTLADDQAKVPDPDPDPDLPQIVEGRRRASGRLRSRRHPEGALAADLDEPSHIIPRSSNPDKLLFIYPLTGGRGGISVTDGDRDRMTDGEYLNDVLIEFGFKHILAELDEAQRDRVHVFNSFFYKKLSTQSRKRPAGDEDGDRPVDKDRYGYEAVKKWTAKGKVDVFEKDLIIVPINEHLHWYLAVIYNPRGILRPAPSPPPDPVHMTRTRSKATDASDEPVKALLSDAVGKASNSEEAGPHSSASGLGDLVKVCKAVYAAAVGGSASDDLPAGNGDSVSSNSAPRSTSVATTSRPSEDGVEVIVNDPSSEVITGRIESLQLSPTPQAEDASESSGVPLVTRSTTRIKTGNRSESPECTMVAGPSVRKPPPKKDIWGSEDTWIMTFDSLGGSHAAVGRKLAKWLEWEAQEKRNVQHRLSPAQYHDAKGSLQQSNSSDCGVYVLHSAECIMKDPQETISFVERPPSKSNVDRAWHNDCARVWKADDVKTKRSRWLAIIDSLSDEYAKLHRNSPAASTEAALSLDVPDVQEAGTEPLQDDSSRVPIIEVAEAAATIPDQFDSRPEENSALTDDDIEALVPPSPRGKPTKQATGHLREAGGIGGGQESIDAVERQKPPPTSSLPLMNPSRRQDVNSLSVVHGVVPTDTLEPTKEWDTAPGQDLARSWVTPTAGNRKLEAEEENEEEEEEQLETPVARGKMNSPVKPDLLPSSSPEMTSPAPVRKRKGSAPSASRPLKMKRRGKHSPRKAKADVRLGSSKDQPIDIPDDDE